MRASIKSIFKALKTPKAPSNIWQQAFDRDPDHLYRLCSLNGKAPNPVDLVDYSLDIHHEVIQPDLFRYLIPICLEAWYKYLFDEGKSAYTAFVEHFSAALASRPILDEILDRNEYEVVLDFVIDSILDRLDKEKQLAFSGFNSVYKWFYALSSFAVIFPALKSLWERWWLLDTNGHAIAALQYISCLMYEENQNPIFATWTHENGGGPPELWETDGWIYDRGWKSENILFLSSTLTVKYIELKINEANNKLHGKINSDVPERMVSDFNKQKDLLASRIAQLPSLLQPPFPF